MYTKNKQMFVATNILVLVVGGIIAAIAGMSKNKDTRMNTMRFAWVILGAGGLLLLVPAIGDNLGIPADIDLGFGGAGTGDVLVAGTVSQATPSGICAVEDTTVTLSAIDRFTAVSVGGTHRYKINGAPALFVSDTGTFTASPGDELEILWGNGSGLTEYYNDVSTESIPCSGTKTFSRELLQNGSITIDVFNEDGNRIDAANNESLAPGDVVTLSAKLRGQFQRGTLGGVIVCEYNSSVIDDCIVDFGGAEVSVPSIYVLTSGLSNVKAYSVPAVISTEIILGTITIDVDDVNDPETNADSVVNMSYYPAEWFVNEDTGASFDGPAVEDEDDVATKPFIAYSEIFVS